MPVRCRTAWLNSDGVRDPLSHAAVRVRQRTHRHRLSLSALSVVVYKDQNGGLASGMGNIIALFADLSHSSSPAHRPHRCG